MGHKTLTNQSVNIVFTDNLKLLKSGDLYVQCILCIFNGLFLTTRYDIRNVACGSMF